MDIRIGRFLQWAEVRGRPFQDGKREVIPIARSLSLMLSRRGSPVAGRFVWTRPIAVEVVEGGAMQRIPIPDYGMWIALGIAIATILVVGSKGSRKTVW
ncbi:MAG: hypothetical protein ACOX87_15995 [Chloroflexota bacterium]|jgi:hypothetical protein